jgi:SulP family sulfate permease
LLPVEHYYLLFSMTILARKLFPFLSWLQIYNKEKAIADLVAGLTVAVVLVPQGMAYAMLAGLPPVYGLYAGLVGAGIAALFGSSTQLSTGPVAIVSFLVLTSLAPLATPETTEYITLAILLALLVGIIQFAMGVFKLGFIMNFVSHSVIVGFSSAAAIIIASTQVPSLLGIKVEQHELVFETFFALAKAIPDTHIPTLAVGVASVIGILFLKRIHKMFPSALVVVVFSILASTYFNFKSMGISVVGAVPSGIPFPTLPELSFDSLFSLAGTAVIISVIGFMEAFAIAKALATKRKEKINVNQELIGQGLANMAVSFFKGYPVSGSFSRSAVNDAAGGMTGMSSVIVSIFVLLSLLFLAPYLYSLPKAVLASIVIIAVIGLIDIKKFKHLWHIDRNDGVVALTTFVAAFLLKPDYAIFIGIILSLVLFLRKSMQQHIAVLGRVAERSAFADVREDKQAVACPLMVIVRPSQSIYFGNVERTLESIGAALKNNERAKVMIFDGESVSFMDASSIELFEHFIAEKQAAGMIFVFANIQQSVYQKLHTFGLVDLIGSDHFEIGKGNAIKRAVTELSKMHAGSCGTSAYLECAEHH